MIVAIQTRGRQQEIALQALYRKSAEFRRYFKFKGLPHQTAEDLVQELIIKIFRSASSYSGSNGFGKDSANSWMWTIARNTMNDHLRVKKSDEISLDDEGLSDASMSELEVELANKNPLASVSQTAQECVAIGIENFAAEHPDRARALEMQLDGEDIASIGKQIGRTVAAAKEYLSQCKKKLAPFIKHCTELLQP